MIRVETSGDVKETAINENIHHPNQESVSVVSKGKVH
jgi:hypothetical protein